jgi:hypothetical protein
MRPSATPNRLAHVGALIPESRRLLVVGCGGPAAGRRLGLAAQRLNGLRQPIAPCTPRRPDSGAMQFRGSSTTSSPTWCWTGATSLRGRDVRRVVRGVLSFAVARRWRVLSWACSDRRFCCPSWANRSATIRMRSGLETCCLFPGSRRWMGLGGWSVVRMWWLRPSRCWLGSGECWRRLGWGSGCAQGDGVSDEYCGPGADQPEPPGVFWRGAASQHARRSERTGDPWDEGRDRSHRGLRHAHLSARASGPRESGRPRGATGTLRNRAPAGHPVSLDAAKGC